MIKDRDIWQGLLVLKPLITLFLIAAVIIITIINSIITYFNKKICSHQAISLKLN